MSNRQKTGILTAFFASGAADLKSVFFEKKSFISRQKSTKSMQLSHRNQKQGNIF